MGSVLIWNGLKRISLDAPAANWVTLKLDTTLAKPEDKLEVLRAVVGGSVCAGGRIKTRYTAQSHLIVTGLACDCQFESLSAISGDLLRFFL
jgi:hypothetical protein